jgi:CubicO group peptidase (beta-lactamase class C family)
MAWGYIYDTEKAKYMPADSFPYTDYATFLGNRKGPGRVSSNAVDLLKWDHFLRNGDLFADSTLQVAYSPAVLNNGERYDYGFGWNLAVSAKGDTIIKHNGENPGYRTIFIRLPSKKRVIVFLTNNQPTKFLEYTSQLENLIDK